jgi:hypothetical protein
LDKKHPNPLEQPVAICRLTKAQIQAGKKKVVKAKVQEGKDTTYVSVGVV